MRFGLIGYPLTHSMSPFIHYELFSLNKKDFSYNNIEITPENLNKSNLPLSLNGFNVTIPHKISIIPFLAEIKNDAKLLKTVNTVKNQDGKLIGYNTDCEGFLSALKIADIKLQGKILICGYGGTSRMMCYLAAKNKADITICCRKSSISNAWLLADEVNQIYNTDIKVKSADDIDEDFDLLLNGTPAGMYPKNIELVPVSNSVIKRCAAVFDAVYNPKETLLLKTAKSNGSAIAYGMPMLVYQAAHAQKIWFDADFDDNALLCLIDKTNNELERIFTK